MVNCHPRYLKLKTFYLMIELIYNFLQVDLPPSFHIYNWGRNPCLIEEMVRVLSKKLPEDIYLRQNLHSWRKLEKWSTYLMISMDKFLSLCRIPSMAFVPFYRKDVDNLYSNQFYYISNYIIVSVAQLEQGFFQPAPESHFKNPAHLKFVSLMKM